MLGVTMKKCSPFWVSFFHARTGIEEGGAAGGSVKNMPAKTGSL
jgi:hypothetical protein